MWTFPVECRCGLSACRLGSIGSRVYLPLCGKSVEILSWSSHDAFNALERAQRVRTLSSRVEYGVGNTGIVVSSSAQLFEPSRRCQFDVSIRETEGSVASRSTFLRGGRRDTDSSRLPHTSFMTHVALRETPPFNPPARSPSTVSCHTRTKHNREIGRHH